MPHFQASARRGAGGAPGSSDRTGAQAPPRGMAASLREGLGTPRELCEGAGVLCLVRHVD